MRLFSALFHKLESTTKTNQKIKALVDYFEHASPEDKVWTIALFSHKRPKRTVSTTLLRQWAAEKSNIPLWLFEDTYHIVGDLAETIAKVIPKSQTKKELSLSQWIEFIKSLAHVEENKKKEQILSAWDSLSFVERFLFNKIITGGFRLGVSQKTIVKALSKHLDQEENIIAHKLMGNWDPAKISFEELVVANNPTQNLSKPYPFYLAYALDSPLDSLGIPEDWYAEYKWDGIRGQIIKRENQVFVWSRGEELITPQFPEFQALSLLPFDFVIDGEILVSKDDSIGSFNDLQKRLGRKKVSKKMLSEYPVFMKVYDLLEINSKDIRQESQEKRREELEDLFSKLELQDSLELSELLSFQKWDKLGELRNSARENNAEGLMLKSKTGDYKTGRKKGDWFKWKLDPMTIDAVMLYAQRGHGRRANWFTDFTFAVKDGDKLVTFAKAYSGLTDLEFQEISKFVRKNTKERFGPVHSVNPELVFELAFEGISESKRHKCGVAVRFPRISRWRKDKPLSEINTIEDLKALIN